MPSAELPYTAMVGPQALTTYLLPLSSTMNWWPARRHKVGIHLQLMTQL
jgi:hypothetical protein